MEILLTIRERLALRDVLRATCRGKKLDPKRKQARDVLKKFSIPKEELSLYELDVPGIGIQRIAAAVDRADKSPAAFDLSKEDARFLQDKLSEGLANLGPEDDEWLDPLEAKLGKLDDSDN